jgi:hypothetical protein
MLMFVLRFLRFAFAEIRALVGKLQPPQREHLSRLFLGLTGVEKSRVIKSF